MKPVSFAASRLCHPAGKGANRHSGVWAVCSALAIALLGSGCCGHLASSTRVRATALPVEVAREFDGPKISETSVSEAGVSITKDYLLVRYELSGVTNSARTNRPLVLECFLPSAQSNPPVVMILPMLGGSYPLEKFFGKYFAKHGLASVIVHREDHEAVPVAPEALNHLFRQTILDNKRAIDWLETRTEVDASRLGVFGVSMGAIKGALLMPMESRVRGAVLAMPAGDLPYVLTYTTERGISRKRDRLLQEQGITEQELRMSLEKSITWDPIRYAQYVDPEKVMLVLAAFDSTVPIKKGLELRAAMGKPETIVVGAGHYTAALYIPYLRYQSARFLKSRLFDHGEQSAEQAVKRSGRISKR